MTAAPRRAGGPRGTAPRTRPRAGRALDGARLTAYDVLDGVTVARRLRQPAAARSCCASGRLDERDAAFATQLAYGTLRAQGTLDAVLPGWSTRPLAELDPRVLDLLRLGAYQLLDLRVPVARRGRHHRRPHPGDRRHRRLRAGQRGAAQGGRRRRPGAVAGRALGAATATRRLALATDHPRWIVEAWRDALGGRRRSSRRRCWPTTPRPRCTWWPGGSARDELVERVRRRARAVVAVRRPAARRRPRPAGRRCAPGRPAVQDEGSQLAALLLARAPLDGPDAAWLDMCAGPGGKAGLLAAVRPDGVRLTAADRAPHRAELVRSALAGADDVEVLVADGTAAALAGRVVRPGAARRARAPGWARCAAGPRCAGAGPRTTSPPLAAAADASCSTARWPRSGPGAWSPT